MVFIRNAFKNTFLFFFTLLISCGSGTKTSSQTNPEGKTPIINQKSVISESQKQDSLDILEPIVVGANQTELYLPLLKNKKVAIVGNQTSVVFKFPNLGPLLQTKVLLQLP